MSLRVRPLAEGLQLRSEPAPVLPPTLEARLDETWASARQAAPTLFDSPKVSVVEIGEGLWRVTPTTYRQILGARRDPQLAKALRLRPLAVSGLLICPDGLVLGRRGAAVTDGAGQWELVPSGAVDPQADGRVDPDGQIRQELLEELGVAGVVSGAPLGYIENTASGVIDLVIPLWTELSRAQLEAAHRDHASAEYDALRILWDPATALGTGDVLLPETRAILEHFLSEALRRRPAPTAAAKSQGD